jgi:hypothetical protein
MRSRHFDTPDSNTTSASRIEQKTSRSRPFGRTLLITLVLIAAAALVPAGRTSASVDPAVANGGLGPIADLIGDLIDTLEEVEEELDAVSTSVGGNAGPLQGTTLTDVGDALDAVEAIIEDIFDDAVYPSLEPVDAGTSDTSVDPATLPDYATDCLLEIRAALGSLVVTPSVDADYVGSRLKTILHLLPGFREEAGL